VRAVCRGGVEHVEDQVKRFYVLRIACETASERATRNTKHGRHLQKLKNKKKHNLDIAFTACTAGISLLKTMTDAAKNRSRLAKFLLSTARSSFDEFQNARKCGQNLYIIGESISWGQACSHPNISGEMTADLNRKMMNIGKCNFSFRGFLREKHDTNNSITQSSLEKGRQQRQSNE
jgi:hypothetical protein